MITNAINSTNTCSFTVTVQKTGDPDLLWAYTAIGFEEVKMKKNTIQSGGVGVTNAGKKVRLESNSSITAATTFVRSPILELTGGSQVTSYSTGQVNAALLPAFLPPNANCGNNLDIPDNSAPVTLSLACYGNIKVGKNVTVTFSGHSNVNVKDLDLKEGSTVLFAQNTTLRVNKKLDTGKFVTISRNGNSVWLHVDDQVKIDDGNNIAVNMHVKQNLIVDKTSEGNPTYMTGLFIANKIDSKDNVFWNWNGAECDGQNNQQREQIESFNATAVPAAEGYKVDMEWTTNEEGDISTYEVEKSTDGVHFTPVVQTENTYKPGEVAAFTAQEADAEAGVWIYRLRKHYVDGRVSHSVSRLVKIDGARFDIAVYPNPATNMATVMLTSGMTHARLTMLDMNGRLVLDARLPEEQTEYRIDLSSMQGGSYMIRVSGDQGVSYRKLIVVR